MWESTVKSFPEKYFLRNWVWEYLPIKSVRESLKNWRIKLTLGPKNFEAKSIFLQEKCFPLKTNGEPKISNQKIRRKGFPPSNYSSHKVCTPPGKPRGNENEIPTKNDNKMLNIKPQYFFMCSDVHRNAFTHRTSARELNIKKSNFSQ